MATEPIHSRASNVPNAFPAGVSAPKFDVGLCVCWHPLPSQDFGTIIGVEYAPAEHLQAWSWCYHIWLDPHSPSRTWTQTDTAWEADLELWPQAAPAPVKAAVVAAEPDT